MRRVSASRHLALVTFAGLACTFGTAACGSSAGVVDTPDASMGQDAPIHVDAGMDTGSSRKDAPSTSMDAPAEASKRVDAGVDAAAQCSDGVKDGQETDVDCGGPVCDALGDTCAVGKACASDTDCKSGNGCDAHTHTCDATECADGVKDGQETGVDCGGSVCDALGDTCAVGQPCAVDADCTSGGCDAKTQLCTSNECTDGILDGKETDVDCGGAVCDAAGDTCAVGQKCLVDADCSGGGGCDVTAKLCVATQCSDGTKDGQETDVDCGGTVCDALGDTCAVGQACLVNADCSKNGGCDVTSHECDATQCHDGTQDGAETGVDCGGPVCDGSGDTCGVGTACLVNGDCVSGNCCGAVCSLTLCPVPAQFPVGEQTMINTLASPAVGMAGVNALTLASPTGFAVGQTVLVQQVQGMNAGQWELAVITSIAMGNATLAAALTNSYSTTPPSTAQAIVVPQFTTVDVPATSVLTAPAWNGATGGVLAFQATGAVTLEGIVTMTGNGFRGFSHAKTCLPGLACATTTINGFAGESIAGPAIESTITGGLGTANANGGGGGTSGQDCAEGGGGAYGAAGVNGPNGSLGVCLADSVHGGGTGGGVVGAADLSTSLIFGGAGGEGGPDEDGAYPGAGGNGGGSIVILAPASVTVSSTGAITSNGSVGGNGVASDPVCKGGGCGMGGGGGGAGGSIRIVTGSAALGANLVQATGQIGGTCTCSVNDIAGAGGAGRIQVTSTAVAGTTTPAFGP